MAVSVSTLVRDALLDCHIDTTEKRDIEIDVLVAPSAKTSWYGVQVDEQIRAMTVAKFLLSKG